MKDNELADKVREANRRFYDIAADVYEEVDGRRTPEVLDWLRDTLLGLKGEAGGEVLLDFGCGSGVVVGCARGIFASPIGMDISPGICKVAKEKSPLVLCGEGEAIPLKDGSVDIVVCFAVLHHILDHGPLIKEIHRVLKKGGILYTDHDMDSAFSNRFRWPLKLYRALFDASKRFAEAFTRL